MRRLALCVLLAGAAFGCSGGRRPTSTGPSPVAAEDEVQVPAATASLYRKLGRLASAEPLPFTGTMVFAAGAGDTVLATLGLSLTNHSLRFEREPSHYTARYRVEIVVRPQAGDPVEVAREEVVRVAALEETRRTDESVLFQQNFKLLPGPHRVSVTVRDVNSGVQGTAGSDYVVPRFTPRSTTAPILVYQAQGRGERTDPLQLVLNPRGMAAFSGDTLLAYIEGYGFDGPHTVPFQVRNDRDSVIFSDSLRFRGGRAVESQVVRLAPDSLVLGEMRLVVGAPPAAEAVTAIVSFTAAWLVTDYDQMLSLLRYLGPNPLLDSLRSASAADRPRLWRAFWKSTDTDPATPQNEQLDEYFARVAAANAEIRDEGIPGWRTERGEVFITLGPPDDVTESAVATSNRMVRWTYHQYALTLFFVDESGFGRFRLIPQSRADYERTLARLRRGSR